MSGLVSTFRAASVAVLLLAPAAFAGNKAPASQPKTPSCCATQTRCCPESSVKHCCDEPDKATCCQTQTACCSMEGCCGSQKQAAGQKATRAKARRSKAAVCNVNGKPRWQCCPTKAVQMRAPSGHCCMKSCATPVHA